MSKTEKNVQLDKWTADTPVTAENLNSMVEAIHTALNEAEARFPKTGGIVDGNLNVTKSLTRGGNTVYDTGNRPTPEEIGEKCIYRSLYIEQSLPIIITSSIKPENDKLFLLDIKVNTNTESNPIGALIQGYQNSSRQEIQNAACVVYSGTIEKEIDLGFVDGKLCVILPAMPPKAMLYVGALADPNGLPNVDQYTVADLSCGPVPAVVNRKVTVIPAHTYSAEYLPTRMVPDNKKEMNLLVGCGVEEVSFNCKGPDVRTELIRMEDGLGQGALTDILARNVRGAVGVYDGGQRVYSPNNKPSAAAVGALAGALVYEGNGRYDLTTGRYLLFGNCELSGTSTYQGRCGIIEAVYSALPFVGGIHGVVSGSLGGKDIYDECTRQCFVQGHQGSSIYVYRIN